MRILGIIPARYQSFRFPGKPLVDIAGKPMIQRVYEQALLSQALEEVTVATDDERIMKAVEGFSGKAILTSSDHRSGTERCGEVVETFEASGRYFDIVINIQGDEPYINPKQMDEVAACFSDPSVSIATLARRIESEKELCDPNVVKVVFNHAGDALYFSRHPIPYRQNAEKGQWVTGLAYFKHIGIYAYKTEVLKKITALVTSSLEQAESLEQLRWLVNGFPIRVSETHFESHAIDTPDDLSKIFNNG
jgi:3-deoxy-manno-octulosonate cytidylyltransferase (CMP-KDO synthetase)